MTGGLVGSDTGYIEGAKGRSSLLNSTTEGGSKAISDS